MELERIKEYISKVYWKEAVTYRETAPHEYTIRHWRKDLEAEFVEFVKYIRLVGNKERFYSRVHSYFYLGDHKYWTMGDPIDRKSVV